VNLELGDLAALAVETETARGENHVSVGADRVGRRLQQLALALVFLQKAQKLLRPQNPAAGRVWRPFDVGVGQREGGLEAALVDGFPQAPDELDVVWGNLPAVRHSDILANARR